MVPSRRNEMTLPMPINLNQGSIGENKGVGFAGEAIDQFTRISLRVEGGSGMPQIEPSRHSTPTSRTESNSRAMVDTPMQTTTTQTR